MSVLELDAVSGLKNLTSRYVRSNWPPINHSQLCQVWYHPMNLQRCDWRSPPSVVGDLALSSHHSTLLLEDGQWGLLSSLWQMIGKPPIGQERTCYTVKLEPQTQWVVPAHNVRKWRPQRHLRMWRQKPNSCIGTEVSQVDMRNCLGQVGPFAGPCISAACSWLSAMFESVLSSVDHCSTFCCNKLISILLSS